MELDHARSLNHALWEERAPAHAASAGYGVERFASDPSHLSDVVRFDVPRLGDIAGLDVVHLQCHIGTDTVSLARLGARVTGLDFSETALAEAARLAELAGVDARWVHAELYDAPDALGATYDVVYTGVGALCWLPDIRGWARVVDALLRPGGRLFLREGHPMLWALADARSDGLLVVDFPYFEVPGGTAFTTEGTYVDTDRELVETETIEFNHGLGEIIQSLLDVGLVLTAIEEHDSVPWDAMPGQMERLPNGEHRLIDRPERLACSYTLQARKPG